MTFEIPLLWGSGDAVALACNGDVGFDPPAFADALRGAASRK
jgi:hypothetical protein